MQICAILYLLTYNSLFNRFTCTIMSIGISRSAFDQRYTRPPWASYTGLMSWRDSSAQWSKIHKFSNAKIYLQSDGKVWGGMEDLETWEIGHLDQPVILVSVTFSSLSGRPVWMTEIDLVFWKQLVGHFVQLHIQISCINTVGLYNQQPFHWLISSLY